MTEEKKNETEREGSSGGSTGEAKQSGDPGRTPGSAEGDRQTVEEDLRNKGGGSE